MKTCIHLEPLERELEARGIALGAGATSPYGPDWGIWFEVNCTFDERSLRARLAITNPPVSFTEYDGHMGGTEASWYCRTCKRAIMGSIARYTGPGCPRVS